LTIPAYLIAYRGVSFGRRGDVPDWTLPLPIPAKTDRAAVVKPFCSAAAAQFWLESRNNNVAFLFMLVWFLVAATASNWLMVLPLEEGFSGGDRLATLLPFSRETTLTFLMFSPLATMPIFVGATMGIDIGKIGTAGQPSAFLLTRPQTTSDLITP